MPEESNAASNIEDHPIIKSWSTLLRELSDSEAGHLVLELIADRFSDFDASVAHDYTAIYWVCRAKAEIDTSLGGHVDNLTNEPTWALIRAMLNRVFDHSVSSIIAFLTGSISSAEALARTVVESAINTMYVTSEDRSARISQYFFHYVENERKELIKWSALLPSMKADKARIHQAEIEHKSKALEIYHRVAQDYMRDAGVENSGKPWPNIAERFRQLGMEESYRTVYAAMCSQVHNDAEDLMNHFVIFAVGDENMKHELLIENVNFSCLLVYEGVRFYLEAALRYAKCFNLVEAFPALQEGQMEIDEMLKDMTSKNHF